MYISTKLHIVPMHNITVPSLKADNANIVKISAPHKKKQYLINSNHNIQHQQSLILQCDGHTEYHSK